MTIPNVSHSALRLVALEAQPLTVPLREPFVIATGQLETTRAAMVIATLEEATGARTHGYGEAAAFPPVTTEDQPEVLAAVREAADALVGLTVPHLGGELVGRLQDAMPSSVARAGVEGAIADAWSRMRGMPLWSALTGDVGNQSENIAPTAPFRIAAAHGAPPPLATDITLPISAPEHMATLAARYKRAGFDCFKVKVGRDSRADRAALRAVAAAVPGARFRLDANAGFSARQALALLEAVVADGLTVECFEQPCARDDLDGMAEVTARSAVPVVADESFRSAADLDALAARHAAHAVNLKLVKLGGPIAALTLARAARAAGFRLMAGAMVETRLGLVTMAHVVAALGGVDWVDLDTAFLLADDPFNGGWSVDGCEIALTAAAGHGVDPK